MRRREASTDLPQADLAEAGKSSSKIDTIQRPDRGHFRHYALKLCTIAELLDTCNASTGKPPRDFESLCIAEKER